MVRMNPRLLKSLSLKPVVLECDGCKADIRESQVYACVTLSFESMDPIATDDLTPEHYEGQNQINEKRKALGEPPMEPSDQIVSVRDAEALVTFCMRCAEKMGLTKPIKVPEKMGAINDALQRASAPQ